MSCTSAGSRAVHGLGSVAAVQMMQPGHRCWFLEVVSIVHCNSFQQGQKLLNHYAAKTFCLMALSSDIAEECFDSAL